MLAICNCTVAAGLRILRLEYNLQNLRFTVVRLGIKQTADHLSVPPSTKSGHEVRFLAYLSD